MQRIPDVATSMANFYQLLHLKCGPLFADDLSSQWFLIVQNVSSDLK